MNKRTVQLLLIDGTAGGRLRASLDNWTGIAYKLPKPLLAASKDREELNYCGVYFFHERNYGKKTNTPLPLLNV